MSEQCIGCGAAVDHRDDAAVAQWLGSDAVDYCNERCWADHRLPAECRQCYGVVGQDCTCSSTPKGTDTMTNQARFHFAVSYTVEIDPDHRVRGEDGELHSAYRVHYLTADGFGHFAGRYDSAEFAERMARVEAPQLFEAEAELRQGEPPSYWDDMRSQALRAEYGPNPCVCGLRTQCTYWESPCPYRF